MDQSWQENLMEKMNFSLSSVDFSLPQNINTAQYYYQQKIVCMEEHEYFISGHIGMVEMHVLDTFYIKQLF